MKHRQREIFESGEADKYFNRTKQSARTYEIERFTSLFRKYSFIPKHVLDVGCADGHLLDAICSELGCKGTGIEPSTVAIQSGKVHFPSLELHVGTADNLSQFAADTFDCVIVNFVLHWIDRNLLLKVASELDRVLKSGGVLIIGDFAPAQPCRTRYHHTSDDDVFTFKQDYAAYFCSSCLYSIVAREAFDFSTLESNITGEYYNRLAVTLLKKDTLGLYPVIERQ